MWFLSMDLREVEATSKKGMERVRYLFKGLSVAPPESHALDLIALNADGSLRDAETMLDQLSLLGNFSVPAIQAAANDMADLSSESESSSSRRADSTIMENETRSGDLITSVIAGLDMSTRRLLH
ncbi:hypothetical protein Syun_025282 [Stephania yunnanensis]|uniref:DNA polymerase III subunit gamma/tau helical lid domain-containing protein n=1 Tax=Stephania yunnanensis TaxID=152371 RepID=A0AAP0EWS1_9MAGN